MKHLKFKTKKWNFGFLVDRKGLERHFLIDCLCGEFYGCHYESIDDETTIRLKGYKKSPSTRTENTFYLNEVIFLPLFKRGPITLICNNCESKVKLTRKFYDYLKRKSI